jgi:hypothetical protein
MYQSRWIGKVERCAKSVHQLSSFCPASERPIDSRSHIITQFFSPLQCSFYPHKL